MGGQLNALRITEQLAIFEARFMDRSDAEPIGNFTAAPAGNPGRALKKAQEAALDEALTNLGFGLQFACRCMGW